MIRAGKNRNRTEIGGTPRASRGVTLVELMIALLIGSVLLIGAITVYVNSSRSQRVNEALGRLQENARFALDTLEPDVRLAGFWGLNDGRTTVDGAASQAEPVPAGLMVLGDCAPNFSIDLNNAIAGDNNGFPYAGCPPFGAGAQANSDTLIVRRATTVSVPPQAGRLQVQSDRIRVQLFADGGLPPGFAAPPQSQTNNVTLSAFYVSQDSVLGAGIPSLRRKTLVAGPLLQDQEVIPGVEDFQVQFGVDSTGDGNADQYVNPGNQPAGSLVVAVRIWLLMRAEQIEVGFVDDNNYVYADQNIAAPNDGFRRTLVSKTIEIRNTRS